MLPVPIINNLLPNQKTDFASKHTKKATLTIYVHTYGWIGVLLVKVRET